MNDDFLYRIRTEPPEPFARELKSRLDRSQLGASRRIRLGMGLLMLGTAVAFAVPGVRNAVVELFATRVANTEVPPANELRARPDKSDVRIRVSGGAAAASADATQPRTDRDLRISAQRWTTGQRPPATSANQIVAGRGVAPATDAPPPDIGKMIRALGDLPVGPTTPEGAFTKVWPLMEEPASMDDAVKTRLALFNVMAWNVRYLEYTFRDDKTYDPKSMQIVAERLQQLALMIDDAFEMDTRKTDLPVQARDTIWTDRATFRAKAMEMAEEAETLAYRASMREPPPGFVARQAKRLILTCTGCHEIFREGGDIGTQIPRVPP